MSDYLIRVKTSAASAVTQGIAAEFWDVNSPLASLKELRLFIQKIENCVLPGILSVEVQQNDVQGLNAAGLPSQILQAGTVPVPTSGQPAVGWIIVATAGNTTLTIAPNTGLVIPFVTSQALTAAQAVAIINADPVYSKLVVAALDPAGVTGKVTLTALTMPWDHVVGGAMGLSVSGTGTSASGATFGATNTFPARQPVNGPNNAIRL
jgi:hypothetical protein